MLVSYGARSISLVKNFGPGLTMVQQSLAEKCRSIPRCIRRWMSGYHTGRSSLGDYCIWQLLEYISRHLRHGMLPASYDLMGG